MKYFAAFTLITLLALPLLHADQNTAVYQGQKTYLVKLKTLFRQDERSFASQYKALQWHERFQNHAQAFIEEYSSRYPKASRYLHSKAFQERAPFLEIFLTTYAKESGRRPQCTCTL